MATRADYVPDEVAACYSVVLELMTLLGEFREHLVLVGGWVPYLVLGEAGRRHVGSLDVDVALDFRHITAETYHTILEALQSRGYYPGSQPYIFQRRLGPEAVVEVDFLAAEYGGTGRSRRHQRVQDVKARKARGCDLAFDYHVAVTISGPLPEGEQNQVTIKVASLVPFLVMKGMALWERMKEKDAYDIYFCVRHAPGGLPQLREQFAPLVDQGLVREGLGKIKAKFAQIEGIGPQWAARFQAPEEAEEQERLQRDAFERVNAWLDELGIEPYAED